MEIGQGSYKATLLTARKTDESASLLMRLSNGCIKRKPLMERDGSGVSALVGPDGVVVCARLLDTRGASGGWRWRPPVTEPDAGPVACERSVTAAGGWSCR
jgi:hypothetical protein